MSVIPSTKTRVEENTPGSINAQIEESAVLDMINVMREGPEGISRRLEELDREWDIERALEANAATASMIGITLGLTAGKRWFIFPIAVAGFLLQHAIQGWCPPVPIMRKLGFRTAAEIDAERNALRILRGDFGTLMDSPVDALRMAEDGNTGSGPKQRRKGKT